MTNPIDAALDELADEFELLGDWEERYRYVIELGKELAMRGHSVHVISTEMPFRLGEFRAGLSFHQVLTPTYPLFREPQYLLSLANKVVALRRAKRDKGNRTPYEAFGPSGHARTGDVTRWGQSAGSDPALLRPGSAIVSAYVLNELLDDARTRVEDGLFAAAERGIAILVIEPIARPLAPLVSRSATLE